MFNWEYPHKTGATTIAHEGSVSQSAMMGD